MLADSFNPNDAATVIVNSLAPQKAERTAGRSPHKQRDLVAVVDADVSGKHRRRLKPRQER